MRCSKVERDLAPYLDGLLKAADERAIQVHVAECLSCRAALNDMRVGRHALHELAAVRAPASFAPRVKAIARAHLERTWSRPLVRQEAWGATLAGAVVLVGVSVMGWYVGRPRPYVAPLTASVAMAPFDFGEVAAVARVVERSQDEALSSDRQGLRDARRLRPAVRLVSVTVPAGAGHRAAPPEPEDIVAPAETAGDEAKSLAETPTPDTAPVRPAMVLAALDARLLGMSPAPLTSRSAALPPATGDARRAPRAETDLPAAEVVEGGEEVEEPRLAYAGYHGPDADAPVSFAALLSTRPLASPADMSY